MNNSNNNLKYSDIVNTLVAILVVVIGLLGNLHRMQLNDYRAKLDCVQIDVVELKVSMAKVATRVDSMAYSKPCKADDIEDNPLYFARLWLSSESK